MTIGLITKLAKITNNLLNLPNGTGAAEVGFKYNSLYSVMTNLFKKAEAVIDAVQDFGCDSTGVTNTTTQMLNFLNETLLTGKPSRIAPGDYLITPGVLNFSGPWKDSVFPNIDTGVAGSVRFIVASDINAPMLRINNGEATSAVYRLRRGGSLGGITFVDPFTNSGFTGRHGLAIYGFHGTQFGYMKGINLRGSAVHFERKMYGGTNPDPYNVSLCEFHGIESNGASTVGVNHDNSVGVTHCLFKFLRVVDGIGGIRGLGVACEYTHISLGNLRSDAFQVIFDTLVGGRSTIRFIEIDNCERGYDIETISGLDILESRIVHRYQSAPNTSPVYWPTVAFNISKTTRVVTGLSVKSFHRIEAGGTLAAIGTLVELNNSVNVRGANIYLDITDNAALAIPEPSMVTHLNRAALDVVVTLRGKRIASTSSIIGCSLRGAPAVNIGTAGFATEAAKVVFPTQVFGTGGSYDAVTGFYKVPYSGIYEFCAQISMTLPVGTRLRMGVVRVPAPGGSASYLAGGAHNSQTATPVAYSIPPMMVALNAGDLVFLAAEQNSGGSLPLTGTIDASVENYWSITAKH